MMYRTQESQPAAYPIVPDLSPAAAALTPGPLWSRIENWIAYRWPARDVTWYVDGSGEFIYPLADVDVQSVDVWDSGWVEADVVETPHGLWLPGGRYRVKAMVGSDDTPPDAVLEAYRRLADLTAEATCMPVGANRFSESVGQLNVTMSRNAYHMARALHLSGASDLLRPWRAV